MRAALLMTCTVLAACQTAEPAPSPVVTPTVTAQAVRPVMVMAAERSRQESNRDDVIQSLVSRKIKDLDRSAFRGVTVEVWGGRVLLIGAVIKPEQRRRAEQSAAATTGAAIVINELILAEDRALDLFAPDYAKEELVRRQLGLDGKAGTIVRVVNNVAFLLGGGASREQAEALRADAGEVEGIKWVVAHVGGL